MDSDERSLRAAQQAHELWLARIHEEHPPAGPGRENEPPPPRLRQRRDWAEGYCLE